MAQGSTQPVTEMGTRNIAGGKGDGCVGLTTLPPTCADSFEIRELQAPGTVRAYPGLYKDYFTFYFYLRICGWQ
jgi:hypothetical protein